MQKHTNTEEEEGILYNTWVQTNTTTTIGSFHGRTPFPIPTAVACAARIDPFRRYWSHAFGARIEPDPSQYADE